MDDDHNDILYTIRYREYPGEPWQENMGYYNESGAKYQADLLQKAHPWGTIEIVPPKEQA